MGYRIDYEPSPKYDRRTTLSAGRLQAMTAAFLVLFLLLTVFLWPEGATMLRRIFIPGDPDVTTAAFSSMVEQLQDGEPVVESVTAFCREIIAHGKAAS